MNTLHCDKLSPFWKWRPVEIIQCRESIQDMINLPTYEISLKSNNVECVRYCGGNSENGRPVDIFRYQETIRDIIIDLHMKCRWNRTMLNICGIVAAIWKWRQLEICQCREPIRDIIIYPHMQFWWYRTLLNVYHRFVYAVFWQPFWK